jgi:MFS family permease
MKILLPDKIAKPNFTMNAISSDPNRTQQPSLPPPFANYRWVVVGILWFICFFNYADRLAIFSVFPVLEKKYHFTKEQLGMIGAAFTWVYAAASPVAGHVGDRFPRKWVILSGLYIWSLITGLTSVCTKFWQFLLVRGSEGLGETFYMPASMAIISDYHTPATRSRAIGLHQTSIYAGTIGGGALAGWMAERYGWQSPFVALAIAGIVLGLIMNAAIREPRRNEAERQERGETISLVMPEEAPELAIPMTVFLREFIRTRTAVLLVAAFFGANMVGMVFLTWMPTFLKEKFGLNLALAGLGATFFIQVASMFGAMLGGVTADRWSKRRAEGRILVQALATLLGAPFIFLCGYTRNPWLLVVAMSLFGLSKGVYDSNLTAAFYDVITPTRRSTATGLMNLVGWIGAGLGAVAIGRAVDHHVTMSAAISSTALIYLAVAAILYYTASATARGDIDKSRMKDER